MREADKSYLWCTEAWFHTKPGTTPRTRMSVRAHCTNKKYYKMPGRALNARLLHITINHLHYLQQIHNTRYILKMRVFFSVSTL